MRKIKLMVGHITGKQALVSAGRSANKYAPAVIRLGASVGRVTSPTGGARTGGRTGAYVNGITTGRRGGL